MTLEEIYFEAKRRGLRLERAGDKLAVIPAKLCPPDFFEVISKRERELLNWLEDRYTGLAPDCLPWLGIARRVLASEFDGSDSSTLESLKIGLRSIPHQLAYKSVQKLKSISTKQALLNQESKPDGMVEKPVWKNFVRVAAACAVD